MRYNKLRQKEVVNVLDGRSLGCICDMELDLANGCICAIIVPGPCGFLKIFGSNNHYVIPWKNICKIGEDVILVEVDSSCIPNY